MNRKIKLAAAALALTSVFSLCSFTAYGANEQPDEVQAETVGEERSRAVFERYELSVSKVYNRSVSAYSSLSTALNGKRISADTRMVNGTPYIDVESFAALLGMKTVYKSSAKTLNVKASGFEMDVIDGSNIIYANGRVLFSMTPNALMSNGRVYAPLTNIAKAFGMAYSFSDGTPTLTGGFKPLTHGSVYYAEDAVYWLSRIISAESRGESLLGQIAVGSVVMNRVASRQYPNTIWGVIFDRKYGVQFSPISDGSIYKAPTATAVIAAKICLEGFNVNKSALFFLYPRASSSSWIPNTRDYLFSIGKHDFYA